MWLSVWVRHEIKYVIIQMVLHIHTLKIQAYWSLLFLTGVILLSTLGYSMCHSNLGIIPNKILRLGKIY